MTFLDSLPDALWWNPLRFWWVVFVAVALDVTVRNPRWMPHPVRGIGRLYTACERFARRMGGSRLAGALMLLLAMCIVSAIVGGLLDLPYGVGLLAAVWLSWTGLALGELLHESGRTLALIEAGSLDEAQIAVGMLVTRATDGMDEKTLCRTLAETLSENLNDAFIAPFFWLQCTGPLGLWIYKAVSTMDSMWGYKTERWLRLGWAGARLDDILAYIPARLTAFFYFISAPLAKIPPRWPGWEHVAMQAKMMESPNAGWPMAAAAWLHGAAMGGTAIYDGLPVKKPLLGPVSGHWEVGRVRNLIRHTAIAGMCGAGILWGTAAFVAYWIMQG
jgi:adenosylcobinamide-phosphate synthase